MVSLDPASSSLLSHFSELTGMMVEVISDLARLDTPTGDARALSRFADLYQGLLEEAGAECRQIPGEGGPHLLATFAGAGGPDPRPALVVGHSDTVWGVGEAARRPPRVREGRLHGPGVLDMKAGLALVVFLLRYLRGVPARERRPLRIFISSDEETGSLGARPHLTAAAEGVRAALVLEPPRDDGGLKVTRKGVGIYRLAVRGRAAHAGVDPSSGASAIDELVRQASRIAALRDPARGVTINIGRVEGGIASNVVADRAQADIDVRFDRPEDGEEVDSRLKGLLPEGKGTSLELTGGIVFPPLEPDARSRALAERAVAMAARLGMVLGMGRSGGGSDGSYLASLGVPTLDGLGVEGSGAHTPEEHVVIERLAPRAALLARLALEI